MPATLYKAILFDLDDTLYDLRSYWTGRLRRAFDMVCAHYPQIDHNVGVQTALEQKIYMAQMADFLRQLAVDDPELVRSVSEAYRHRWFDELVLAEDARAVMAHLRESYKIGLVTNGPVSTQRVKIEQFDLVAQMDVLIVSEEVGVAKPDPKIFQIALAQLGTAPIETLYVGDSIENDLYGAAAAGLPFIWMNPRNEPLPADAPPPMAIIQRLAELPPFIEMQGI